MRPAVDATLPDTAAPSVSIKTGKITMLFADEVAQRIRRELLAVAVGVVVGVLVLQSKAKTTRTLIRMSTAILPPSM
jgi:hypothetical protein